MQSDTITLAALGSLALLLFYVLGSYLFSLIRYRSSPEAREKNRRAMLWRAGRVAEGTVVDLDATAVYYTYTVNGVPYSTAQDISAIEECLPEDRNKVIGEASVKFDVQNPANSIVVSEQWSGFRAQSRMTAKA